MAPISYKLPRDIESPPELTPTRDEARQVRAELRRSVRWRDELGALGYALGCSGAVHAVLIVTLAFTLWGDEPAQVKEVSSSDSALVKATFIFEKEKPKTLVQLPKLATIRTSILEHKPLVQKESPKAVAKKILPKKKAVQKKRRVAKRPPPKAQKLAGAPSSDGTEAPPKEDLKVAESEGPPTLSPETEEPTVTDAQPDEKLGDPTPEPAIDYAAIMAGYRTQISGAFSRRYRYPRRAERAMLEGTVIIEVIIASDGTVLERRILKSSGHEILDQAALQSVASITQVPAPPSELKWDRQSIQVPFVYRSAKSASAPGGWGS